MDRPRLIGGSSLRHWDVGIDLPLVWGCLLGGFVGLPTGKLLGVGVFRGVAGVEGLALLGFGQCVAGPGEAVGGVFDGGDVHRVIHDSGCLGGGEFPDVGYRGFYDRSTIGGLGEGG